MEQPRVISINVGQLGPNPNGYEEFTAIRKKPVEGAVQITAPGWGGSGLGGDVIADGRNHGGPDRAVYIYAREDLDAWEQKKGITIPNGKFGENLTTVGIDGNEALVGEEWRIGDEVVLQVTCPRIPCSVFAGELTGPTWIKEFTVEGKPGPYLRVVQPGEIRTGDPIEVVFRPDHELTIATLFRIKTTQKNRRRELLQAADYLPENYLAFANE
ncbi:MAG: MOSC domain-containing protein [Thermomicrobiales bacterium]|nr:MOSC domain-containing protein [Thermomicrobiales bacterium]